MTSPNRTSLAVGRLLETEQLEFKDWLLTCRAIAEKYKADQTTMQNVVSQMQTAAALATHDDKWPGCPHCRIEAAIGTLQEAIAFDPLAP